MSSAPTLIDESVALWAARLVAPTQSTTDESVVARLRADVVGDLPAVDAAARGWTGLGAELPPTQVRVVGRVGWVRANLGALHGAFDPLAQRLRGSRVVASRVLGAQVGALLGLLSTKVLGQYVLPLAAPGSGQLLVVGPNVLDLAEEFGRQADDIRRTVLLHEVTHRLQFDAVSWLGDHLRGLVARYLDHARLEPSALWEAAARLPEAVAQVRESGTITPLVQAVLTPEQARVIDEAQGLMSLLEGHGNAAMTLGAGDLVSDVEEVRETLQRRRGDVATRVLTAVAGLDLKRRQYREGEAFVRAVVAEVGTAGLNVAFDQPDHLPRHDEVGDPQAWLARVRPVA